MREIKNSQLDTTIVVSWVNISHLAKILAKTLKLAVFTTSFGSTNPKKNFCNMHLNTNSYKKQWFKNVVRIPKQLSELISDRS